MSATISTTTHTWPATVTPSSVSPARPPVVLGPQAARPERQSWHISALRRHPPPLTAIRAGITAERGSIRRMVDPGDLLDEQQVMRLLRVSRRTLQRLRQKGTGPPYVKVGRRVLYRRQAVADWLKAKEKGGP